MGRNKRWVTEREKRRRYGVRNKQKMEGKG
jgi:hypothetical protein